jgi:hypothetical protein
MKRDWELVREILIAVESIDNHRHVVSEGDLPAYDGQVVSDHIYLLQQAGLVTGTCRSPLGSPRSCEARELTWAGHEFLDNVRSQTVWKKTRSLLQEKGLDLTFDTIKAAAGAVASSILGGSI